MEAVGLALSVTQTLFAALQNSELKHIMSIFGCESELEKLQSTVERINAVLQDAEGKEELTSQERDLVRKLKHVLYDADDILDKFKILAEQHQLLLHVKKGSKLRRKVRRLISRFGMLGDTYYLIREVRDVREKLEGVSNDANKFKIKVDDQPLRRRREETCSYVYQQDIIGREDDVKNVVDLLLDAGDHNAQGNISVLSIVGMGGLGKTALAQLVFNEDQRIKENFCLRLWACVADEDERFDVASILSKILKSATDERDIESLGIERLQRKVREILDGNKYLLVLDDVWTEKRVQWMKLENFLKGSGRMGSRIVVTTRSEETAKAVGNRAPYILKGLSEEASWRLFKLVALGKEQENLIPSEFVEIGTDIVKKCANVPLAIRVIGSLLFGQDKDKWLAITEKGLSSIWGYKNDIDLILKFSYYHLETPLKSCFTYCALFPKDTAMNKQLLISLWMAQGYLEPLNGDQNLDNVGEEYFSLLLRRCFFQDVKRNHLGEIFQCKMHDLIYDIAHEVAGKEICIVGPGTIGIDKETRHVNHLSWEQNNFLFTQNRIRTYIYCGKAEMPSGTLPSNWIYMRSLDLSNRRTKVLPAGVGELLHLRYLNLSFNQTLEMLPRSITKLRNLQTLDLTQCIRLKELPHDLNKLVRLRVLDIAQCNDLTFMPLGMEKLTRLSRLPMFVLGGRNSSLQQQQQVGDIQDLQGMRNLKGTLLIRIMKDYGYVKGAGYLSNKEHLNDINIHWENLAETNERLEDEKEGLLEALLPLHNLERLSLRGIPGTRMPEWARENKLISFLPNIVHLHISNSCVLELPPMSKLCSLKGLVLFGLYKLEYVENNIASASNAIHMGSSSSAVERESFIFFPSLVSIVLLDLPVLKGWWRSAQKLEVRDDHLLAGDDRYSMHFLEQLPSFPHLNRISINNCPNFICMPLCPTVRELILHKFNENLRIMAGYKENNEGICLTSTLAHGQPLDLPAEKKTGNVKAPSRLRHLSLDDLRFLKSLPRLAIDSVEELTIMDDQKPNLSRLFGKVFNDYFNSIRSLEISLCGNLCSLSGVLDHLSGLENLNLSHLYNMSFEDEDEDDGTPWKSVANTLQTLMLCDLPQMMKLPVGIRHLTSLRTLEIVRCVEELEERCRSPDGLDWPLVQNVPVISIRKRL